MESRPPIQYNFDKGETDEKENEKQQVKDYIIKSNNICYKLIVKKDSENIEFKINKLDKLNLYYYYNKYSLEKIIDYLKIDISTFNNLSKIMKVIDNSYLNNKIYVDIDDYNNSKLIIILDNEISKNYKSTFNLIKKELLINEKFEIIINEVNEIKKCNDKLIKNKFNDIEKILLDLKESTNKTIKGNIESINSLKSKIKENEDLLKKNKNIILSLRNEIEQIKKIFSDYNFVKKKSNNNKSSKNSDISKNIKNNKKDLIEKEKSKSLNQNIASNNNINEKDNKIEKKKEKGKEKEKKLSELKINKEKGKENLKSKKNYKIEKLFEDEEEKSTLFFNLMIIGDNQVGKSWIFDSLFSISLTKSPSIGLDSDNIYIKLNDEIVALNITDSPGSDAIYKMNLSFASKQDFIIFVYSIDNIKSFETITSRIKEIKKICKENTHYILVGNKKDLIKERVVSMEKGLEFAKNENLDLFMEISAKTGENVDMVFYEAAKILYESKN